MGDMSAYNTGGCNVGSTSTGIANVGIAQHGRYNTGSCTGDFNGGDFNTGFCLPATPNTGFTAPGMNTTAPSSGQLQQRRLLAERSPRPVGRTLRNHCSPDPATEL